MNIFEKLENLKDIIKKMGTVAVAFSGGVDSTFLAKVCQEVLGSNTMAITLHAAFHANREIIESKELTKLIGIEHLVVDSDLVHSDIFRNNPENRCYLCKTEVFSLVKEIAEKRGFMYVVDGSNVDDLSDYRPGMQALKELGIRSPLVEAELTKADIRELSAYYHLPTWNKAAFACLATRIPYGESITEEKLKWIELGENYLCDLGFTQYRVRLHDSLVRIEVLPSERNRFFDEGFMDQVSAFFKNLGFKFVTLELGGYKMGSMNQLIQK